MFILLICCYNRNITKLNWLSKKRFLLVAGAVVFLAVIFFLQAGTINNKESKSVNLVSSNGIDGSEILQDLINKDTDQDGVPDWEESLWGTDPRKKDTDGDGIPDGVEIEKLKQLGQNQQEGSLLKDDEDLTETEKFSRELFSTIVALNQVGTVDQNTIDKLGASLFEQMESSVPRKIYTNSDIKLNNNNNNKDFLDYNDALNKIYENYPIEGNTFEVLQEFISSDKNTSVDILLRLDPTIEQIGKIINAIVSTSVPSTLAQLHLDFINGLERKMENLSDMQLFDIDPIVAIGAINKYEKNIILLDSAIEKLGNAIRQKLNN